MPRRLAVPSAKRPLAWLALALVTALAGGCSLPTLLVQPVSSSPQLEEVTARDGRSRDKVAIIPVEGLLLNATTGGGFLGAEENKVSLFRQQLERAAEDDEVVAVVLRINSPGGTVAASEAMRGDVERFKRRTGKPVVAACQDVAASGGYYVAVAADEIYAAPGGIVGSIGVILNTFDLSGLLDKVGVAVNPITSGPLKDLGSPFDDLSDRERDVLQGVVDAFYEQFRDVVTASRDVSDQEAAFDGRVYTSGQAVEAGLVDAVASLDQAITRAARLGGSPRARAIQYTRPYGYRGSIYARGSALQAGDRVAGPVVLALPGAERLERLTRLLEPGAYYLWMP